MASFPAAIVVGAGQPLVVDEIHVGDPGPREVFVELVAAGVCHSQLHLIDTPHSVPMLLGHEASGRVLAVGSQVTHVAEGDNVLLAAVPTTEPGSALPVSPTWRWRGQTYDATDRINVFAWSTHTMVDERNLTVVPPDVPLDVASILGCAAVTGCGSVANIGGIGPGDSVAVWGVGGVGMCSVIAGSALGARHVIAVDIDDEKLDFARRLGATDVVNARDVDAVTVVKDLTSGGVDCAVDTTGVCMPECLQAAKSAIPGQRTGGMAVIVAGPKPMHLDMRALMMSGKRVIHSVAGDGRPQRDLPRYVDWVRTGKFPLHDLVTRRYRLDAINDAVQALESGAVLGRSIIEFA